MTNTQAVGVFDSGVGGLSICQAIHQVLPKENIVYFADDGFSPYGTKTQDEIDQRTEYIVRFLISHGCKALVIACNTATVTSIDKLRKTFSIPIVGVEPGIKPAAILSETKNIAVLATEQTTKTDAFNNLKQRFGDTVTIHVKACPEFVTLVEALNHQTKDAEEISKQILRPLLEKNCDQIVLGCTHFSFLKQVIQHIVGTEVNVIDTGLPVARQLSHVLQASDKLSSDNFDGQFQFWTTGDQKKLYKAVQTFLKLNSSVFKV